MAITDLGKANPGKTLISTTLVTAGVASIAISSIPQIYTDLLFVWRNLVQSAYTGATSASYVRFNNDSTSGNYRWQAAAPAATTTANASSTTGAAWSDQNTSIGAFQGYTSDDGAWGEILIYNYASTSEKLVKSQHYQGVNIGRQAIVTGTYRGTSVTSINMSPNAAFTYTSGTLLLYGIV